MAVAPSVGFALLHAGQSCDLGALWYMGAGATIMKTLDIVHPAAKTLVDISLAQDAEVR